MRARWLVRLYPKDWRRRYGDEFEAMLAAQQITPGMVIDIVAGALDARVRPQAVAAVDNPLGVEGERMTTNLLKRCASGGPRLDARDQRIGTAVMLGSSLVLAALYVAASARYRGNELVDAFGVMLFPLAMTLALPFTYLKDQTRRAKTITIGITLAILALASYLAVLI